jgi:hypothetical protein
MAVNNKKSPSSKNSGRSKSSAVNGASATSVKKTGTSKNGNTITLFHVVIGIFSLVAGLLTPPLWELYVREQQAAIGTTTTSFKTTISNTAAAAAAASQSSSSSKERELLSSSPPLPKYDCDFDTLSDYLHDVPIPGLHVVCFQPSSSQQEIISTTTLTFYKNAMHMESPPTTTITTRKNDGSWSSWSSVKSRLESRLGLRPMDELHQPWAIYSPTGQRLVAEDDDNFDNSVFLQLGMVLVFQGGQWIYPGVRKGFIRHVVLDETNSNDNKTTNTATLETLSLFPLVLSVDSFLTERECDLIQETATPMFQYSEVSLMDHDKGRPASDFRTSQTAFLRADTPELVAIDQRTAALVRTPRSHQEFAQVLRYGVTEKYDTHVDCE